MFQRADAGAHPVYDGPVIDAHTHFDATGRSCAATVLSAAGLPDHVVNFWDLRLPPPSFRAWAALWERERGTRMSLLHAPDLSGIGEAGFERRLIDGVAEAAGLGAVGLKVWKNLGLTLRDAAGRRVAVDDERLSPLWEAAAALGLPVAIHVGDPPGFFEPIEPANERYLELREHPEYWFGDRARFPSLAQIHAEFDRLVRRHRATTFVGLHFGCFMPLRDVAALLADCPSYLIDTTTRTFDLGREPMRTEALEIFARWPERVIFGTDLIRTGVYDLPVAGDGTARDDATAFYAHHWRLFETDDEQIAPPFDFLPQQPLRGLALELPTLRALYHDNARRTFRL